ncbi:hypothetical protein [Luteibacter sp. E-22]|uniref:hypothetical protein n=1 Tax=Luteibacter sp. E-22 TaxID=3404050 RepID=UPI003CEF76AF
MSYAFDKGVLLSQGQQDRSESSVQVRLTVKKIDWTSILHEPQYIGFRITMIGVAVGFTAFAIAICGLMELGIWVFVVGLSTALTGIAVNFSHINRRR